MYFVLQGADFSQANLGQIEIELGSIGTGGTIDPNAKYTLTVNVNVEGATIKLTPEGGSTTTTNGTSGTIEVTYNTKVNIEVSKEDYNSYTRELTITRNRELSVELTPIASTTQYTLTITPDPTSATVTLTATGYSTVSGTGNQSITVADGTEVNWSVSAEGYIEQNGTWTANGKDETLSIVLTALNSDITALVSAYSTSMTSAQQSALSTYVNTIKANSTLASKIKKMYMPILSTTLDDVRINVADYINNNTATVDTFAGTWNDSTYGFKNNGIYNISSSTNVYTTTGVAGMSSMKMNNLGLISVFNITAGSTNGTRLTSTGGGCFFLRNYSAGNAAVQGTHSGQTGTYCGKDLSELYGVSAGYFQNKTTAPCIDMMMFSENQLLGLENATGDVKTYSLASAYTDTINVNMQDTCYFSYLIPTTKANTDYGTVGYMILITEALTANEMVVLRDAINTFVDAYLA